jgi:hypothetical protein
LLYLVEDQGRKIHDRSANQDGAVLAACIDFLDFGLENPGKEHRMERFYQRILELARRGAHLSPNGHLKIQVCFTGSTKGPFEKRINNALLAARPEEQMEIFRQILQMWHSIRYQPKDSDSRREAERILGPTLCSCCCGREAEPITATVTADGCQVRIWHGLPQTIGAQSVEGTEKPLFSVSHTDHAIVAPYAEIVRRILLTEAKALDNNQTGYLQEVNLANGTLLIFIIQMD